MKIVLISDTHNQHNRLILPEGDMIIHAGDVSANGSQAEVLNFIQWFSQRPFKHKIFIAGNHDFAFENQSIKTSDLPEEIMYLENSTIDVLGLKIFGSPYTPEFYNWAFMKKRGEQIRKVWNQIPDDVDILITHGPPLTVLDENAQGRMEGCEDLLLKVKRIKPKMHVFGHIHESYGAVEQYGIKFFNASVLNDRYEMVNGPVVVDFKQTVL